MNAAPRGHLQGPEGRRNALDRGLADLTAPRRSAAPETPSGLFAVTSGAPEISIPGIGTISDLRYDNTNIDAAGLTAERYAALARTHSANHALIVSLATRARIVYPPSSWPGFLFH